jgi:hypothetical protein
MTTDKKLQNPDEKSPEVDRIRDIIFGSQMRAYEGNFQTIQRDLERHLQEIERLNEKLIEQEKSHSQKLQALEREIRKADDTLRTELRETAQKLTEAKVDRQMLGGLFIELGSQLKSESSFAGTLKEILESRED